MPSKKCTLHRIYFTVTTASSTAVAWQQPAGVRATEISVSENYSALKRPRCALYAKWATHAQLWACYCGRLMTAGPACHTSPPAADNCGSLTSSRHPSASSLLFPNPSLINASLFALSTRHSHKAEQVKYSLLFINFRGLLLLNERKGI